VDQLDDLAKQATSTGNGLGVSATGLAYGQRIDIHVPDRENATLRRLLARVNADLGLYQLWCSANVTAVPRLAMNDHGPVHIQIVANSALKLLRMIVRAGGVPSVVRDYGLSEDDAEVVVVLGALLHDVGMAIHRAEHELYSLIVAQPPLARLLDPIYDEPVRTAITAEVLHTIIAHRAGGRPLTLEAGIVRVADALDMAHGRSRIPYESGQANIHAVSAAAIEKVEILAGARKAVKIAITMANSAGIYQVDELLKDKLVGSGLEPYVEVEAKVEGECERHLIDVARF
jgi:metal-dependent HD superfamily phosphatase/phosphodiesterase